ncbi:MAG: thiamine phosphate synthase [Limisphaerales bacterium]
MLVTPLDACRLYAFVDSGYLHGRDPLDLAARLCEGGADLVQLRAKDWPPDRVERLAEEMLPLCEANGVNLVINDHPEIAARIGAPLCHLGQEDFFEAGGSHVSTLAPGSPSLRFGLSSHAPEQATRARTAGAAYIAVGPVYPTPTKPGRPGVTLDYVRWAATHLTDRPWFAIGGINAANLDDVLAAGATRVCIVSAILEAPNVVASCREFRRRLPP